MGKKTVFTNITPLPPTVSREVAIAMLHNHDEMIELNPLVIAHHRIGTPRDAPKDEFLDCVWQEMTDRIHYLPGGVVKGKVSYKACFHDVPNGLQTHIYAPMNLDIREKWTICGTLPGEPVEARELGLNTPRRGLYLREDGEMKCNILMTSFVRKNLDNAHKVLVDRILAKAERTQAHLNSQQLRGSPSTSTQSIPAFQPGSRLGSSTTVRQLTATQSIDSSSIRQASGRTSTDSAAVQSVRQPLREQIVQELPGSDPQPQSYALDMDDAEMQSVHPALREQYRRSRSSGLGRSDTVLPAYNDLSHQKGQYYQGDMAKRPQGRQFAAELEGSHHFDPDSASSSTPHSHSRDGHVCELAGPAMPSRPLQSSSIRCSNAGTNSQALQQEEEEEEADELSRLRSWSQPNVQNDTLISSSSNDIRTLDRYSIISDISNVHTPRTGQYGFDKPVDNRYSVVSAITEASTPRPTQGSFTDQQLRRQDMF